MNQDENWLIRFVHRHPGLCVALLVMGMTLPQAAFNTYAGYCLVDYLKEDRSAQDARDYWSDLIAPLSAEDRRIELRIYSQTATQEDYARKREILEKLVALDRRRDQAVENNPPPDFPTDLCGLIQIG